MNKISVLICSVIFLQTGCGVKDKEKQIQMREDSLDRREQELIIREKALQLREQSDSIKRDSYFNADSSMTPSDVFGSWQVTLTCTETTCNGSAVGDSKTEKWMIQQESGHILAKAMDGEKLIRIYIGKYTGNIIELTHTRSKNGSQPEIKMIVRLRIKNGTIADGQREIIRENECKVVYTLQLEKL